MENGLQFDKSAEIFPVKKSYTFLNSCGVSACSAYAAEGGARYLADQASHGRFVMGMYPPPRVTSHQSFAKLLKTKPENISVVPNYAYGANLIANGYPFKPGDEIIGYAAEYPSNVYPWAIQERTGRAVYRRLSDCDPFGTLSWLPKGYNRGWSMDELRRTVTPKTRVVALSHVQFTSGFAADLMELGGFCKDRGIDLVLDAAQSLGCLPVYPEEWGISAVVASGWKWLLGPIGTGVMYTSPEFRAKIEVTHGHPYVMKQDDDYLNHAFDPVLDGGKFEMSTPSYADLVGLESGVRKIFNQYTPEAIRSEVFRLQDIFLSGINRDAYRPLLWPEKHRSGILSLFCVKQKANDISLELAKFKIDCTARGERGREYLRIAPHFFCTEADMEKAVTVLNEIATR